MWLVRFKIRSARPLARGITRFMLGPSSTKILATLRSSISAPSLCSALAIADSNTFFTKAAAFLLVKVKISNACATFLPRIKSATKRAFWAEVRA